MTQAVWMKQGDVEELLDLLYGDARSILKSAFEKLDADRHEPPSPFHVASLKKLLRLIKGFDDHDVADGHLWDGISCHLEAIFGPGELAKVKLPDDTGKDDKDFNHRETYSEQEGDVEMTNKTDTTHREDHAVDERIRWSLLLSCRQAQAVDWEVGKNGPATFVKLLLNALPPGTVVWKEVETWREHLLPHRTGKGKDHTLKLTTEHYRAGQNLLYVLLGGEGHVHEHDRDRFMRCCEHLCHVSHAYAHKNGISAGAAANPSGDDDGDAEESNDSSSDDGEQDVAKGPTTKAQHRTQLERDRVQFLKHYPVLCTAHSWHKLEIADKKSLVDTIPLPEAKSLLDRIYVFRKKGHDEADSNAELGHYTLWSEVALSLLKRRGAEVKTLSKDEASGKQKMSEKALCKELLMLLNCHDTHLDTCKKAMNYLCELVSPMKPSVTIADIHDLMMHDDSLGAKIYRRINRFVDAFDPVSVLEPVWGTRSFSQHVPSAISMKHPRTICVLLSFLLCAAMVFTSLLGIVVIEMPHYDTPVIWTQTTLAISNCHVVLYAPCSSTPSYATFSRRNVVSAVSVIGSVASIKLSSFGIGCRLAICSDLPSVAINITTDTSTVILSGLQNWNVNVTSALSSDASRIIVSETSNALVSINSGIVIAENMRSADVLTVNNKFGPVMVFGQTQPSGKVQYPTINTLSVPTCQERSYAQHQQLSTPSGTIHILNATSLYVMDANSTQQTLVHSMNMDMQNVSVSPATVSWLNSTSDWIARFPNQDFVQVVDVIAPTVGYTLLNSNRQLLLEFSPVLISAVTLFALSPTYRKTSTTLNHYGCRPVGNVFRVGTNVRPTDELSAAQIHQLYFYEEASSDLYQVIDGVQSVVQGQSGTSITTFVPANTSDRYTVSQDKFGEFVTSPLVWAPLTTAVLAISLTAAGILVIVVVGIALLFRKEIVMSLLEYENRRRNRSLCLHPPGLCDYYWSFSFSYLIGWITVPLMKSLFKRSAKDIVEWYCYTFLSREKGSSAQLKQKSYITVDAVIRQIHMYASFTLSGMSSVSDPDTVMSILEHVHLDGAKLNMTKMKVEVVEGVTHCPNPTLAASIESLFGFEYTKSSSSSDCVALSELMLQANMTRDQISSYANIVKKDVFVIVGVKSSFDTRRDKPYVADASDAEDSGIDHVVETLEASCSIFPVFAQMRFEHTAKGHVILSQLMSGGLIITQAAMYTVIVLAPIAAIIVYITLLHMEETKYFAYAVQSRLELVHFVEEMYYFAGGVTLSGDPYEALAITYLAVGCFVIAQPILLPLVIHAVKSIFHCFTRSGSSEGEMTHSSSSIWKVVQALAYFLFELLRFFVLFVPGFATFVFVLYWLFVVLEWWVLGAIIAPKVMLPFATAAITVVGGIVGAGSQLKQMKKDVVERLEQRLIDKMVKILSEPMHLNPQQAQQMTQIAVAIESCNLTDLVSFCKNPKSGMDQSLEPLVEPIAQAIGVPTDVTVLALCIAMKHTGEDFTNAMSKLFEDWSVPPGIAQIATVAVAQMLSSTSSSKDGSFDTFFSKLGKTDCEDDVSSQPKHKSSQLLQSFGKELGTIAKRVMRLTKCDGKTMGNDELYETILDAISVLMRGFHEGGEGCEQVTERMQKLARSFLRGTSRVDVNELLTSMKDLVVPLGSSMFAKEYYDYFLAYEELLQVTLRSLSGTKPHSGKSPVVSTIHEKIHKACTSGVQFLNSELAASPTEKTSSPTAAKPMSTDTATVKTIVEELSKKLLATQLSNSRRSVRPAAAAKKGNKEELSLAEAFQHICSPATREGAWNQPLVKGLRRIRDEAELMLKGKAAPSHAKRLASMVASAASIVAVGNHAAATPAQLRTMLPIALLGTIDFFRRGSSNWEHDTAILSCYQFEQIVNVVLLGSCVIAPPSRVTVDISSINVFAQSPYAEAKPTARGGVKKTKDEKDRRGKGAAEQREPITEEAHRDSAETKISADEAPKTALQDDTKCEELSEDEGATTEGTGEGVAQCLEAVLEILTGHLTPETTQAVEELVHQLHAGNVDRIREVLLLVKLTVAVVGNSSDASEALDIITKVEKIFRSSDAPGERIAELLRLMCKVLSEPYPPAVDALLSLSHGDFAAIGMLLPPGTLSQAQIDALSYVMTTVSHAAKGGSVAATVAGVEQQLIDDAKERIYDTLFHVFDPQNVGYITFDRFNSLIKRLKIVVSGVDAGAIFTKVDHDHSGKMDRREFREAMELIAQHLIQSVLTEVHLHPSQILAEMIAIGLFIILFSVFILFGMFAFTDGSVFTSCVAGSLPGASKALHAIASGGKGLVARAEKILDTIM